MIFGDTLFFISMNFLLGGFITNKLGDRKMIILGTIILSCGVISLLIPTGNLNISLTGFIIIGLGCAPIYPSIIHSTPYNFGEENS